MPDATHSYQTDSSIYEDVIRYAEMGDHRTGTRVDHATSNWIRDRLRDVGIPAELDPWPLRQFQLEACWVEIFGERIGAFPLWHPTAIGPVPLTEPVVLDDGTQNVSGGIALTQFVDVMVTSKSDHAGTIERLAQAGAAAIIGCTPHKSGEIYGQNVIPPHNQSPWPIPVAMIAPVHWHVLAQAAADCRQVKLTLSGQDDQTAVANNVVARLERGPRWVVISTPQSGWFRSAGERGSGVALLLELARWAASNNGEQSYLFLSTSGHEIGHMGIHNILRQDILPEPASTDCWLHLGSSIASRQFSEAEGILSPNGPEPESWLYCSDSMLMLLKSAFADVPHLNPKVYDLQRGEIRWILERGYDAFALMGPQRFFHLASDGPEAVDPELLKLTADKVKATLSMLH